MKHLKIIALASFWLLAVACDKSDDVKFDVSDHDYFPLYTGFYQIYAVEETRYTLSVPETFSYEIKLMQVDSFKNGEGDFTYVIHRSKRNSSNDPWQALDTWSARQSQREAILSEGNIPYLVLKFPILKGVRWDGNVYNNEINPFSGSTVDEYEVTELQGTCVVDGITFDDCITVVQEDDQDMIVHQDKRTEIYSRGSGLIFKEKIQVKYCNDQDRNCIGDLLIDEGVIYKQSLMEYGKE